MTEQEKKKRKKRTIEERLKEIEEKEKKLNSEKSKLMEKKKEEIEKVNDKKRTIIFDSFKKNVTKWDELSINDVSLLCDEIFTKYKGEINSIL